ncbi:hypothetical protein K5N22_004100 [Vibrio vulnificus]|nr:hypothetical protein [Vibrio vulnificus]
MKCFERDIIDELLSSEKGRGIEFSEKLKEETVDYSGAGYFLTLKDPALPKNRVVLDKPDIRGKLNGIDVGYLAYVENHEFTLECYSYDKEIIVQNREQDFERIKT